MRRTVRPGTAAFQPVTSSRTARAAETSRPSVGSSRNRIHGSLRRPRAKFIFWRWPVDRPLTRCWRCSARPTASTSSSTRRPALAGRQAVELAEHPELLADGQDAVAGLLAAGDHVHDPPDLLRLALDVEPEDAGGAGAREQQGRQDLDQGRLARTVRAEQAEQLARLDLEVDPGECGHGLGLGGIDAADAARVDRRRLDLGGHGTPGRPAVRGEKSTTEGHSGEASGRTVGRCLSNTRGHLGARRRGRGGRAGALGGTRSVRPGRGIGRALGVGSSERSASSSIGLGPDPCHLHARRSLVTVRAQFETHAGSDTSRRERAPEWSRFSTRPAQCPNAVQRPCGVRVTRSGSPGPETVGLAARQAVNPPLSPPATGQPARPPGGRRTRRCSR